MARFISLLVVVAAVTVPAADASGQIFVRGRISLGIPVVVPAPPIVVYQPPPPTVYTVVPAPPPPPVVVVRPAPAPAPAPVPAPAPQPPPVVPVRPFESEIGIGLRGGAGLTDSPSAAMGGSGLFLRLYTHPNLQFELSADLFSGTGYAGAPRTELPVQLSALWFFGDHRQDFRLYLLGGIGGSWAVVGEGAWDDEAWYAGAVAGIGLEWRLVEWLALGADIRGFIRHRINERPMDPMYEHDPLWNDGNCRPEYGCTDLQGGGVVNLAAIFYF